MQKVRKGSDSMKAQGRDSVKTFEGVGIYAHDAYMHSPEQVARNAPKAVREVAHKPLQKPRSNSKVSKIGNGAMGMDNVSDGQSIE